MRNEGEQRGRPGIRGLGPRLTLAGLAAWLIMIPFSVLLVVAKMPLNELDAGVAAELHAYAHANPGMTRVLIVWTDAFGPWPWRIAVVGCALWLLRKGATRVAAWAVTTVTVGGLLGLAIKVIVDRARPVLPDPVALAPGDSFPSGHTVNATLGAGVIVLILLPVLPRWGRRVAWAVAAFLALSVGYTRVALGVHWVSDVLAGFVLGVAVIAATTAAFETWRRDQGRRPSSPVDEGVEPESVRALRE
ncbi:phosphatase PAP2 family protein [Nonomuraea gerenzanensis]|uniref:Putative integral membrane protein n=1 Tax=Nonomuraea gerenzanensis TaxID=93944 RepID=A0A1M4E599_9ACTN|nr:phosphatase PAP2 family protein [Nonomuraea gerenzanensis]UBU16161.1 phosphatase PAP2 family protein [Nonomuraea gerenzanensis]SBO93970.1 putative integral membrane protein [Nonomuraea gerenzanensis]